MVGCGITIILQGLELALLAHTLFVNGSLHYFSAVLNGIYNYVDGILISR